MPGRRLIPDGDGGLVTSAQLVVGLEGGGTVTIPLTAPMLEACALSCGIAIEDFRDPNGAARAFSDETILESVIPVLKRVL